ncbi:MAG: c-type cytochrome [Deltaproteobacteria bacterium]|nr:c-type cytochrome [Deltaproteobacteria bacterium]
MTYTSLSQEAKSGLSVVVFVLAVLGAFVYVGKVVTDVSGGGMATASTEGVSPEAGEAIYFGKGKCSTCHSVGEHGSAIRGPNHGVYGKFTEPMGQRAEERARERAAKTGQPHSATDYLVESLVDPGAYVVSGYKNEMPLVYLPPISLSSDEFKAVIMFLQSLGGEVDEKAINLPDKVLAAASQEAAAPWTPYLEGDAETGMELFYDEESNAGCSRCHTVEGKGGDVGPDLTTVAATRTPQYIVESILIPSAVIASGFEPYLVETSDGQYLTGVLKEQNDAGIVLKDANAKLLKIPAADIKDVAPQETSIMPGGFAEDLNVQQLHDVLAYVLTLTGEPPPAEAGEEGGDEAAAEPVAEEGAE